MTDINQTQIAKLKAQCPVRERSDSPVARVQNIAYLIIRRPDPESAARFFVDYGLVIDRRIGSRIYLRGTSTASHAVILEKGPADITTVGYLAPMSELEKLAAHFNTPITRRDDVVGGSYISLQDPDGLTLEINSGLNPLEPLPENPANSSAGTPANTSTEKPRINATVRNSIQPRTVAKLGHTVWSARSLRKTVHWYQDNLGMIVSDFQFIPEDPNPLVAFMRCDNGEQPTDHHTLGVGAAIELGHVHSAFEMDSFEDVAVASQWMRKHHKEFRYTHGWGIGRHVLGSQIFDYWRDPYDDLFEHYADGDLFDSAEPTGYHLFHGEAQHQWGPDITPEFIGMKQPMKILKFLIKRLPSNDELTLKRLIRMLRAI